MALMLLALGAVTFFASDLFSRLSEFDGNVNQVREVADHIHCQIVMHPWVSAAVMFFLYTLVCAVPFPFVSLITVLVGYWFGLVQGLLITSFGSAVGGSILFLFTRRFAVGRTGQVISEGFTARFPTLTRLSHSQDFWMATSVRFVPGLPFFIPSLVFGATNLSLSRFFVSTQLGLLITMIVYVNAGQSLSEVDLLSQVFSPSLIASMLAIALLPLLYRVGGGAFRAVIGRIKRGG